MDAVEKAQNQSAGYNHNPLTVMVKKYTQESVMTSQLPSIGIVK